MAGKTQAKASREQLLAEAVAAAVKLHQPGKLADAEKVYVGILQFDPICFDALNLLAKLRFAQGKGEEALALVDKAIRVAPGSADALNTRSCILSQLGRHEEALATAARVSSAEPSARFRHRARHDSERAAYRAAAGTDCPLAGTVAAAMTQAHRPRLGRECRAQGRPRSLDRSCPVAAGARCA
jgi:tetratricopeptide (TPR) repeat protein